LTIFTLWKQRSIHQIIVLKIKNIKVTLIWEYGDRWETHLLANCSATLWRLPLKFRPIFQWVRFIYPIPSSYPGTDQFYFQCYWANSHHCAPFPSTYTYAWRLCWWVPWRHQVIFPQWFSYTSWTQYPKYLSLPYQLFLSGHSFTHLNDCFSLIDYARFFRHTATLLANSCLSILTIKCRVSRLISWLTRCSWAPPRIPAFTTEIHPSF